MLRLWGVVQVQWECAHLHAFNFKGLLQQQGHVSAFSPPVGEALGPLDQLAPVQGSLVHGEAEAEADRWRDTLFWPAHPSQG